MRIPIKTDLSYFGPKQSRTPSPKSSYSTLALVLLTKCLRSKAGCNAEAVERQHEADYYRVEDCRETSETAHFADDGSVTAKPDITHEKFMLILGLGRAVLTLWHIHIQTNRI